MANVVNNIERSNLGGVGYWFRNLSLNLTVRPVMAFLINPIPATIESYSTKILRSKHPVQETVIQFVPEFFDLFRHPLNFVSGALSDLFYHPYKALSGDTYYSRNTVVYKKDENGKIMRYKNGMPRIQDYAIKRKWQAGDDLHNFVTRNTNKLTNFLTKKLSGLFSSNTGGNNPEENEESKVGYVESAGKLGYGLINGFVKAIALIAAAVCENFSHLESKLGLDELNCHGEVISLCTIKLDTPSKFDLTSDFSIIATPAYKVKKYITNHKSFGDKLLNRVNNYFNKAAEFICVANNHSVPRLKTLVNGIKPNSEGLWKFLSNTKNETMKPRSTSVNEELTREEIQKPPLKVEV